MTNKPGPLDNIEELMLAREEGKTYGLKLLTAAEINEILEVLWTAEKREKHSRKIWETTEIAGFPLVYELSDILDEAIVAVAWAIGLPPEITLVGVGGTWRREATPWSDFDIIWYVPETEGFEDRIALPFRKNFFRLFKALSLEGDPVIHVPGEFMAGDLDKIVSMNLDARTLFGGDILTPAEIQRKVRAACDPFVIASRHEETLQQFHYENWDKNEFRIDFDIKEDIWGLRHLQHILWFLAAIEGTGLPNMYREIQRKDPEVYNALDLMLHIRSWLHLKKLWTKDRKIDLLTGRFWPELKAQFWWDIIERIQNARESIIKYEATRILWEKKKGIKVGDGIKYGLLGLEIDRDSWLSKPDLVIQLLIKSQQSWRSISPLEFNRLEKKAREFMTEPSEKYAQLTLEAGNFSETVRRLRLLGIIEQVFPSFNALENQTFPPKHRHANINRIGGVLGRLENLEHIIKKDLKDIHDTLTREQQAGIRIALTCKDIPTFAEITRTDYFWNLKKIHSSIPEWIKIAEHLVRKHRILFDCARMDDWNDERELKRIATEIGSLDNLKALLVYTCAMLDYGKTGYHHKSLWDKTFALYHALYAEMEWDASERQHKHKFAMMMLRESLSPEQDTILRTAQETFLRSRYVSTSDSLVKTMMYLERAQNKWEPQIKVTRNQEGSIRIIVSCQYTTEVGALITGTCLQNNTTINDAEIHTFWTEPPLAVFFLEASSNTSNIMTPWGQDLSVAKLEESLREKMEKWDIPKIDYRAILEKSEPTYLLQETNKTGNYKFIVTAENDTPGFLYALTKLIAEAWADILSTTIYTHPQHNGDSPHVEDTFILGPRNIDQLRKIIAEK